MGSGYDFKKSYTLSQREYLSTFKNIGGYIDKVDVISGYCSINMHTDLQQNYLESLMRDNDRIDTYMNETLQNVYVSSGVDLLNRHTIPKYKGIK